MLRLLYTALVYASAPVALALTALRGLRDPAYRDRLGERFGYTKARPGGATIWIHAVSVGEVQAAAALVRALRARHPGRPLLVTTATPTGAQRVRALFGDTVPHVYLPYDVPGAVRRFLDAAQPAIAIVMEREIWPNLFRECGRRGIPIVLASARVSERSAVRHRRFGGLFRDALRNVTVAAQTQQDADRYRAIGADSSCVTVTGNIKFDLEVAPEVRDAGAALRAAQFPGRAVWVAGSTHAGEEDIVLEAHRQIRRASPDALLILVPRHPNRFEEVRAWLRSQRATFAARSAGERVSDATEVLLADTLGELLMLYAAGDIAFVGGSLVPIGGHNLLEPAALSKAIVVGPHNFNGADIAQMFLESGAALEVSDANGLARAVIDLESQPARRDELGARGRALLDANRGALGRLMHVIEPLIVR
jgi:3-deoxy-D-manno-octulosonic-acid transferase